MAVQLSFYEQGDHTSPFDSIKHVDDDGQEYWLARELQGPLGYVEWRKFQQAIERAQIACKNSGQDTRNHFGGAAKMVNIGSFTRREIVDVRLSRYACYLIAMNGDPRKHEISEAQTYFAAQTRKQEVMEARLAEGDAASLIASAKMIILALEEHERRITSLEQWRQECWTVETTLVLPAPAVEAPGKPVRAALNELVRSAARRREIPYHTLWNKLYHELKYRIGFDAEVRAANSGRERLDLIEAYGHLDALYAIACEVLK